jgi:LmbE family N-acetylglucosaminyl deacetylase
VRTEEARCAAQALGAKPPILLNFPDGKLGDYAGDRALVYRLTQGITEALRRLHPDVIVTWGPDGGMGHPDHRMVSNIVTQLQRAGAPGVPERVFYMYLPAEAMRAMNPQRGEPPLLIPDARYATARVPFRPEDLQASARSMACHFTPTYGSWLNLVERWFAELTNKQLRRGAHRSVAQLEAAIREFIDAHHANPKPFVWTKTADQILENMARFAQRTLDFQAAPLIARTTRSRH